MHINIIWITSGPWQSNLELKSQRKSLRKVNIDKKHEKAWYWCAFDHQNNCVKNFAKISTNNLENEDDGEDLDLSGIDDEEIEGYIMSPEGKSK